MYFHQTNPARMNATLALLTCVASISACCCPAIGFCCCKGLSEPEKQKFWSVQKLIEWVLVAISSCSIGPFSLQKFFTEYILYALILSPGFISENFVLSEIDVEKKQVNTGITRIFRQHQFIEFRNVNVSYMNSNIKLCFLYQFSFPEIVAGSEITIWMDIQYYWQFLQLKPDIINDLCQSMVQFKW